MKIQVCEISGAGREQRNFRGYEWGCQVLCARALRFLQRLKPEGPLPEHRQYRNVVGIAEPVGGKTANEMDDYMTDHPILKECGVTGAMHQYALNHAWRIFELGRERYLDELREKRAATDFYEFEESDAFPEEDA